MSTALYNKPEAATAAVVTIVAVSDKRHELDSIHCSYGATPTGGNLKVESPSGTVLLEVDLPVAGAQSFYFMSGLLGTSGAALIVTLASGAGAVQGILNVIQRN